MGRELPLWVREAAEFEPDGDTIICRWCGTEWVMSPHIAQMVEARLKRANAAWRSAQKDRVVPLRKVRAPHSS